MTTQDDIDDMLDVANFLYWCEDDLAGAVRKEVAWAALCRLIGIDDKRLKQIVGGED